MGRKVRVLLFEQSKAMRQFMYDAIEKDPGLTVVGTAASEGEALANMEQYNPDVMTIDIAGGDGVSFVRRLMAESPIPILVVSSPSDTVFDALGAGAVDFVNKANYSDQDRRGVFASDLLLKLKIASIAKVGKRKQPERPQKTEGAQDLIVAIGASTGGTEATYSILKELRNDLPGIVIVQHMPPVFTRLYAERLDTQTAISCKEAQDGDLILPGKALLAPGEFHMEVKHGQKGYYVRLSKGEKVSGHCPSVDVLFESTAKAAGGKALGILLTGMGADGAKGLLSMRRAGAMTIAQNKETSVVYGMPQAAGAIGAVAKELPLGEIARSMYEWHGGMKRK